VRRHSVLRSCLQRGEVRRAELQTERARPASQITQGSDRTSDKILDHEYEVARADISRA
jgi:hypothetical protein